MILMTESPIKWSFEELLIQIKLPQQLTTRCSRKKRNEAKNNCLMDSGNTYNKIPLLSDCFLLNFYMHLLKSNQKDVKVILVFLIGRFDWRLRACSHEPGTVNYPGVMIAPGQASPRVHMMICCPGASSSISHRVFLIGRFDWRLRACSHEPGTVNYPGVEVIAPG